MKTEVLRAYRFTLAPSPAQEQKLLRWCGNARLAFNYALAAKKAAHEQWRAQVDELVAGGTPETQARKQTKVPIPSKPAVQKAFNAERGDTRAEVEGVCPWWHEVNTYVFQSAFIDADRAWKNWLDSFAGKRAGRLGGYPRFKKRGRARDSFRPHVAGMTRSARGTVEAPGRRVRQKAGLNRAILDSAPGELRRQLAYKTSWYGSQLAVLDRWWPSSKTCSDCGWQDTRQTLSDRTFHCTNCGLTMDRDLNAALNIERHTETPTVASDRGETQNACRASVRLPGPRAGEQGAAKREDAGPSGPAPPRRSNPPTLPPQGHEQVKLF